MSETLVEEHERWLRETPPVSQKARADRIAWSRFIMRQLPRGPERRRALSRYRAEWRGFVRAHKAERGPQRFPWRVVWVSAVSFALTAPAGYFFGAMVLR